MFFFFTKSHLYLTHFFLFARLRHGGRRHLPGAADEGRLDQCLHDGGGGRPADGQLRQGPGAHQGQQGRQQVLHAKVRRELL